MQQNVVFRHLLKDFVNQQGRVRNLVNVYDISEDLTFPLLFSIENDSRAIQNLDFLLNKDFLKVFGEPGDARDSASLAPFQTSD